MISSFVIRSLIKLSSDLDEKGLTSESDIVDTMIQSYAEDPDGELISIVPQLEEKKFKEDQEKSMEFVGKGSDKLIDILDKQRALISTQLAYDKALGEDLYAILQRSHKEMSDRIMGYRQSLLEEIHSLIDELEMTEPRAKELLPEGLENFHTEDLRQIAEQIRGQYAAQGPLY